MGVFAFAAAVDRFIVANERRKMGLPRGLTILSGVIHIIFGLLMIYAAVQVMSMLVIFSGIYLLAAGIMVIISVVYMGDLMKPVAEVDEQPPEEEPAAAEAAAEAEEQSEAENPNTGDNE